VFGALRAPTFLFAFPKTYPPNLITMAGVDLLLLVAVLSTCFWLGTLLNPPPPKRKSTEEKFTDALKDLLSEGITIKPKDK